MRRRAMMMEAQRQAEAAALAEAEEMARQAAMAERARAAEHTSRLKAEREQAMAAGRAMKEQAEALAAQVDAEREEKERIAAELDAIKRREAEMEEAKRAPRTADLSGSGLTQFGSPTSRTDVFEKGVYAWTASGLNDSLSDAEIIEALRKRLKYIHTPPEVALAACVREPRLARDPDAFASYGVDPNVLIAFAGQLLYSLSDTRAAGLLSAMSGGLPIVAVPRFLSLFGGGGGPGGASLVKMNPVLGRHVDALSEREKRLLRSLREFLFEQHSQMKSMFLRCDPDGNGYDILSPIASPSLRPFPSSARLRPVSLTLALSRLLQLRFDRGVHEGNAARGHRSWPRP